MCRRVLAYVWEFEGGDVLEASSRRALGCLSLYVKAIAPLPAPTKTALLHTFRARSQQHNNNASSKTTPMSKPAEISSPSQLSTLLSSSRVVVVNCKQRRKTGGYKLGR